MTSDFFEANRQALSAKLNGGIIVVSAYSRVQRSNDMAAHFQQESNFWYLTGINEPDAVLVIDGSQHKSWLALPDVDDIHRTFDGGVSAHDATRVSGIKSIISSDEMMTLLRKLARKHGLAYTIGQQPHAEHFNFVLNPAPLKHYQVLERTFKKVQDCRKDLSQLRAIKRPEELVAMKKAISITTNAFSKIKATLPSYKNEYEIEADFSHAFRHAGAAGHAYDPIVASGKNACTLHYVRNEAKIRKRELVLMDVGASYGGYAADITRTFALGAPTKRQIQIHAAVERAHHTIIELLEPLTAVEEYQRQVDAVMTEAIKEVGLYSNEHSLRRYFPHAISHGLGLDVHDSLGGPKHFEPGMVLTVEPGIYIPEESLGVRIEDDILLTDSGHQNLSRSLSTEL